MAHDAALSKIFGYIDSNKQLFMQRLKEAVEIPSVSGEPARRGDIMRMVEWTRKRLEAIGSCRENGKALN